MTTDPSQLIAGGDPALASQGVDEVTFVASLMHAALATNHTLELMAQLTGQSGMHDASALSVSLADIEGDSGNLQQSFVLGTAGAQPFGTGVDTYNEGNYDYWTEALVV